MIVGVTGVMGAGKSTISAFFKGHNFEIFNADHVAHEALMVSSNVYNELKEAFPQAVLSGGEIDRNLLRGVVFGDPSQLLKLENLIHPFVIDQMHRHIKACSNKDLVLDIPLLYELKLESFCDYVVVAWVERAVLRSRVLRRKSMTEDDFKKVMDAQWDQEKKKKHADFLIYTGSAKSDSHAKADRIVELLKEIK